MGAIDIYNTSERYDILLTDPPWQQSRGGKKAARPNSSGKAIPYETMSLPEIMELHRHVNNAQINSGE